MAFGSERTKRIATLRKYPQIHLTHQHTFTFSIRGARRRVSPGSAPSLSFGLRAIDDGSRRRSGAQSSNLVRARRAEDRPRVGNEGESFGGGSCSKRSGGQQGREALTSSSASPETSSPCSVSRERAPRANNGSINFEGDFKPIPIISQFAEHRYDWRTRPTGVYMIPARAQFALYRSQFKSQRNKNVHTRRIGKIAI